MVRWHRIRYLMDRCRPWMIQPAIQESLLTYRKPLGISSNHEIWGFTFWPRRGPRETDRPQHQNHQKPLGKSWNHENRECDTPETIRFIIKSWNGMGSLGWYMSQGSGSGGDLRKSSKISWLHDYIYENEIWNEIDYIISYMKIWNHEIIW